MHDIILRPALLPTEMGTCPALSDIVHSLRYEVYIKPGLREPDPPPFFVSPNREICSRMGIAGRHLQYRLAGDLSAEARRVATRGITSALGGIELIPWHKHQLVLVLVNDRRFIGGTRLGYAPLHDVRRVLDAVPLPED